MYRENAPDIIGLDYEKDVPVLAEGIDFLPEGADKIAFVRSFILSRGRS
ncbi:MAG: hypothetical protein FWG10_07750 [Eubacteriaceae bacterium]|nr:hypothetical protein [Eubacteriaceae bacterium]